MVTAAEALVRCDCCQASRPAAEVFAPYAGAVRCRDTAGCQRRMLYEGTGMEPPVFDRPAPVSSAAPCAICGTSQPPGGLFERSQGVLICCDRSGCDARAIETQFLTAHGEEFRTAYTSAEMRAAAIASVRQVAADVPADVTEARQAAARADLSYSLAAAGRRR
ncbi:MAG: hypothetical protein ACRDPY_28300 [Streptosporangiaceae bacterium]